MGRIQTTILHRSTIAYYFAIALSVLLVNVILQLTFPHRPPEPSRLLPFSSSGNVHPSKDPCPVLSRDLDSPSTVSHTIWPDRTQDYLDRSWQGKVMLRPWVDSRRLRMIPVTARHYYLHRHHPRRPPATDSVIGYRPKQSLHFLMILGSITHSSPKSSHADQLRGTSE